MKLGNYKGLTVQAPDLTISDKELSRSLRNLQRENAVLTHIDDRSARLGDQAIINFQGYVEGEPIPGAKGVRYPLILGSHSFIPGFEDQLTGRNIGDSFDIFVTFPENYPKPEIAGRRARFSVTLLSLGILDLPEIDDDFALDFSDFQTAEELKDALMQSLTEKKEDRENDRIQKELLTQIIESSEFTLNETIVAQIQEELILEFEEDLAAQSLTMEQFLKRTGQSIEQLQTKYEKKARRNLAETTVLHAIAESESIELTEDELEDALYNMADYYETDPYDFLQSLDPQELDGMKLELLCQKAMDFVLEHAQLIPAEHLENKACIPKNI